MARTESLQKPTGDPTPLRPSFKALLHYQGRDIEITYERDPQPLRGPCTIGFEEEEKSHPYWLTFTMPWLARRASEGTWILERDTPVKRIAVTPTTVMRAEEDGSATLELKGGVTYKFLSEKDRIAKPTARNIHKPL